jgi:hypothetical protein
MLKRGRESFPIRFEGRVRWTGIDSRPLFLRIRMLAWPKIFINTLLPMA